jgi:hypothetical protein
MYNMADAVSTNREAWKEALRRPMREELNCMQ